MTACQACFHPELEDRHADIRDEARRTRLDAFDDEEIELALKSVSWTPWDVHQFLNHRVAR